MCRAWCCRSDATRQLSLPDAAATFAAVRGGISLGAVARTDDEDCDDRERAGRRDRSASSAAEQRRRRVRRIESATRERRQQPSAEHTQEYQSRHQRPQIGADFEQRPQQRYDEQRAVDVRAALVAAPEKNRRRQQQRCRPPRSRASRRRRADCTPPYKNAIATSRTIAAKMRGGRCITSPSGGMRAARCRAPG